MTILEYIIENVTVDDIFNWFFEDIFDRPSEHKEECLAITVAKANEHLDNIIENLKGWKLKELAENDRR